MSDVSDDVSQNGSPETSAEVSLERLVHFIHEAGMLRHTPRTGYQFLGSGRENVAEHSYRVVLIGYALAKLAKADVGKTVIMCLIHDFHEARTGDFNYVNYLYNSSEPRRAMEDALKGTGLEEELMSAWKEQDNGSSQEAILAHDADQLDLIFNLIQERELGNRYAEKWLVSALERLHSPLGRELAAKALDVDPASWWFGDPKSEWWISRDKNK